MEYRGLKIGEIINIVDEIKIDGKYLEISRKDFITKKFGEYVLADKTRTIRRRHPQDVEKRKETKQILSAVIRQVRQRIKQEQSLER